MRLILSSIFILFLTIAHASAEVKTVAGVSQALEKALRSRDIASCYRYATKASHPYIKRLFSYQFQDSIPKNITYNNLVRTGERAMINASIQRGDREEFVQLIYLREGKEWKIDVPETLHHGLGDGWKQQLDDMEQLYLIMQSNGQGSLSELLKTQ